MVGRFPTSYLATFALFAGSINLASALNIRAERRNVSLRSPTLLGRADNQSAPGLREIITNAQNVKVRLCYVCLLP
jgi:hypothetical protein